jgi:HJR/Mrr/RecB family endonuclease
MNSSGNTPPMVSQVTIDQVDEAERNSEAARQRRLAVDAEAQAVEKDIRSIKTRLRIARMKRACIIPLRRFFESWTTMPGGYVLLFAVGGSIGLLLSSSEGMPWLGRVASALISGSVLAVVGSVLFSNSDQQLEHECERLTDDHQRATHLLVKARSTAAQSVKLHEAAQQSLEVIRRLFDSRLNQIRSTPWEGFTGVVFEQFLRSIFEEWGYGVETTRTTGDQGVDLIVSKNGVRTAIQVKGYPGTSVGNAAIQEAHAGKSFYRCDSSAVITNSRYTSGAEALASSVNCHLIDAVGIRAMLDGSFPF